MSSIIVYGEGISLKQKRVITRTTKPAPSNFYGDSKWKAEKKLQPLNDERFHIAVLRPPMIYGENCKGNYRLLAKIAETCPIFPDYNNERSMLYIGNLCEYLRLLVETEKAGLYFPQNPEYVNTSNMVCLIANAHKKKICIIKGLNAIVYLAGICPGKIGGMVKKAFGSMVYQISENQVGFSGNYQIYHLKDSIKRIERLTDE